jgi:uncharacterized protein YecT (DUF1311 family)
LAISICVIGCGNEDLKDINTKKDTQIESYIDMEELDDYIMNIKEQSDAITTSLENDILTQTDMNLKSQELYKLWDDALNFLWGKLERYLSEEEFLKLRDEQRIWIEEKEKSVEEAGKDFEGGSMYPLVVNTENAEITEERVYELYELFK